ncbi:MAG: ligase-associated DNA damage response exonuclease [Planctomycetota bacterium]|nr:ligase-associated DNA damage response exonuclease [Planctomycetota bacterium]
MQAIPSAGDLLRVTESGLYCERGDFYVDPWRRVPRAIITHAHADHARAGCDRYLCAAEGKLVLRARIGGAAPIDTLRRGERVSLNGVAVSLHPAGHLLGSAQVRIEHGGTTWVVTGDYKLHHDPTCAAFEPVRCDVFVTESTFGLPVYRWQSPAAIAAEINAWWRANRDAGRTSVILAYALGKAQRLAALVDPSIGPIVAHGAVMKIVEAYRASGVRLPPIDRVPPRARRVGNGRALVIAPPSVLGSSWLKLFGESSVAMASGWMTLRGVRRRRGFERGFAVSDHADFPGLLTAIEATGARRVLATHGFSDALSRYLRETRGLDASVLATRFAGEAAPDAAAAEDDGVGDDERAGDEREADA